MIISGMETNSLAIEIVRLLSKAFLTGISLPRYPRYETERVSLIKFEAIFMPKSPLILVTVPFPLFFNAIVAKGNGSEVSLSMILPVIYFTFTADVVSAGCKGCLSRCEIMIYLSIIEKTSESFFRILSRIRLSFVALKVIMVFFS